MNILQEKIIGFCNQIQNLCEEFNTNSETKKMNLETSIANLSAYVNKELDSERMERKEKRIRKKINSIDLDINSDKESLFYLFSPELKWNKDGFKGKDENWIDPIDGGFCINSIYEILTSEKKKFWAESYEDYEGYEPYTKEDFELINQLAWFDSPTSFVDRAITPFYTCLKIEEGKFPSEFYFYDSHFVYKLPFGSYEEYFEALIASACIESWQFFYIKPSELIKRNIGKNYFTVFLKSPKIENQSRINFNPEVKEDRLDVIHGYLEHCVTALPEIFPEIDFSYHINYFKEFNKLYLESKK